MKAVPIAVPLGLIQILSVDAASLQSPSPPSIIPPWPAVIAYASAHQISLDGIDLADSQKVGQAGGSITVLATFRTCGTREQWLTELKIAVPTAKEIADNPPQTVTFKSPASGRTFQYGSGAKLAIDIRTVGPFVDGRNAIVTEKNGRAYIGPDLLGLGLDRYCRTSIDQDAEQASAARAKGSSNLKHDPAIPPEAEEREAYGAAYSLAEFLKVILSRPELVDILWSVADKPSAWSIVMHGGNIAVGITSDEDPAVADSASWALPGHALFRFPVVIHLNGIPALRCALIVTSPRPPLLACAGIVGIAAEPAENSDRRLEIRVVAAHRSAP
ncbi:MAG: hypothetical protein WCA95_13430 [Opitutaceae bacterium]